jgi:hypothetical protein
MGPTLVLKHHRFRGKKATAMNLRRPIIAAGCKPSGIATQTYRKNVLALCDTIEKSFDLLAFSLGYQLGKRTIEGIENQAGTNPQVLPKPTAN